MSSLKQVNTNYIFFLQFGSELPKYYYSFSYFLTSWNIALIPIRVEQLTQIGLRDRVHILSVVNNFNTYKYFKYIEEKIIDFAILNKKICLYDITSFGPIGIFRKAQKTKSYYYYQLPINIENICQEIMKVYYNERIIDEKWPGGTRVKLPSMVS